MRIQPSAGANLTNSCTLIGDLRFVSTRLRHLRLSPDGTTLVVKSEKGGVDHELALDELLEVLTQKKSDLCGIVK